MGYDTPSFPAARCSTVGLGVWQQETCSRQGASLALVSPDLPLQCLASVPTCGGTIEPDVLAISPPPEHAHRALTTPASQLRQASLVAHNSPRRAAVRTPRHRRLS